MNLFDLKLELKLFADKYLLQDFLSESKIKEKEILDYCKPLKFVNKELYEILPEQIKLFKEKRAEINKINSEKNQEVKELLEKYNIDVKLEFSNNKERYINNLYIGKYIIGRDDQAVYPYREFDLKTQKKYNKFKKIVSEEKQQKFLKKHNDVKEFIEYENAIEKAKLYFDELKQINTKYNLDFIKLEEKYPLQIENILNKSKEIYTIKANTILANTITKNYTYFKQNFRNYGEYIKVAKEIGLIDGFLKGKKSVLEVVCNVQLARLFHEIWCNSRVNKFTKTITPSWKELNEEPSSKAVIREINGKKEIDIANTPFDELPIKWKLENYLAAKVAIDLVLEGNHNEHSAGVEIHNKWLERNPQAQNSKLSVPFDDLPHEEQLKDINQFILAKEIVEKNKNLIAELNIQRYSDNQKEK